MNITAKMKSNFIKLHRRTLSVLLAIMVLAGSFAIVPFIANADVSETKNYPLLREVEDNGPTGKNWSYGVHDYAEKPDFKTSDENFAAPKTEILSTGVKLSWDAFSGADSYTVNIYNGANQLSFEEKNVTSTEITVPTSEFSEGAYQIQLIAFSGSRELSASMVRPFEFKEAVSESELLTNLGGNVQSGGGRFWANETDDALALQEAPVDKLHGHTLGKSACFWFNSIGKLPSGTQAIAFWYSQKIPQDGSVYALRFQLAWQTPTGMTVTTNPKAYFIPVGSKDKIHTATVVASGSSTGYTLFDNDRKNGEYLEGWVVFPLSNYTDAAKEKLLSSGQSDLRIYWATEKTLIYKNGSVSTTATNGDNRRHYVSELHAISDVNAFLGLYKGETDSSYAASGEKDFVCDTYSKSKEFYNVNSAENKYTLSGESASFVMTDDVVGTKGMQLDFTADETGYYDLSQKLAVVGNASGVGKVFYRVKRTSDNKTVYPTESEWKTVNVNGTNPAPKLNPVTVYLKKGESLRIEAYTELTSGNNITIDIGNPTVTFTECVKAGSGEFLAYRVYDYFLNERDANLPYYINDRFEFKMLDYRTSMENPTEINFTKYNKSWSNCLYYNVNTPIIGFWGLPQNKVGQRLKFKAAAEHGPEFIYNVTDDGYLDMYVPIVMEQDARINVRIVKNNEQIWPQSGFATVTENTVRAQTVVKAGDKIKVQFHSSTDAEVGGFADAIFSQSVNEPGNSSYSEYYSSLWERPFKDKQNYSGDYAETAGSLFSFGYTDGAKITKMDSFDAKKGNFLYSKDYPDAGFSFQNDDLTYKITDKVAGMAISFTAPFTGKYDLSTALKVVSGKGASDFKITVGSNTVWPENGESYVFNAKTGFEADIPAIQLNLNSGDTVNIILTAKPDDAPIVVNLGTPVIYRFVNSTYSGSETIDIYTPYNFTAFEKGAVSTRKKANSRFEYLLSDANGKENAANVYNANDKTVTYKSSGFKFSDTGAVTVNINNTAFVHTLRFTAPRDVTGKLQFEASSDKSAKIRLMRNGKQIWPETGWADVNETVLPVEIDASYKKGDKIEWQVKSDTKANVELGIPNITDIYHVNDYDDATISYHALYGNPFGDKEFIGKYKRYDNEAWLYDVSEISEQSDVKYIVPDKYDYSQGNYLYSEKTETGYYFNNVLEGTVKNSQNGKYGLSLGFIAPRTDAFVFRTGLRITTPDATAKIYARLTVNGNTVWSGNASDKWFTDTAVSDVDIAVPLKEIQLEKGDTVRFEVYTEEITVNSQEAEEIKISFVSPELFTESAKEVKDSNLTAKVLFPYDEFPYYGISYMGSYAPMENRWNYEFVTFGEQEDVFNPDYYDGKSVDLYSTKVQDSPHYNLKTKSVVLTPSDTDAKGINLRYTAVTDAENIFQSVPVITDGADNGNVKFRILHNGKNVWPTDKQWEVLTKDNKESALADRLNLTLKSGDSVVIQLYAEPTENTAGNVTVKLDAFAAVVGYKQDPKILYNLVGENTVPQLDHFWDYEYASDPDNIVWKRLSAFDKGYYNIPVSGVGYCGVSNSNGVFGLTTGTSFNNMCEQAGGKLPIISVTLNVPKAGFYKLGSNIARPYSASQGTAKIRITINDEKVWPEDKNWETVDKEISDFAGKVYELKEGDKLRFECTALNSYEEFITLDRFRIMWPLTVSYSEWDIVYTETNDIFNMLTPEMHEFYLALAKKKGTEFDEEYDEHYAQSLLPEEDDSSDTSEPPENDASVPQNSKPTTDVSSQEITSSDTSNEVTYIPGTEGSWVEGTEDKVVVTPGGRKKQVKHYVRIEYPVLAIVLISVAGALLVAGVIVVIILHKKGKINWFKKRNKNAKNN